MADLPLQPPLQPLVDACKRLCICAGVAVQGVSLLGSPLPAFSSLHAASRGCSGGCSSRGGTYDAATAGCGSTMVMSVSGAQLGAVAAGLHRLGRGLRVCLLVCVNEECVCVCEWGVVVEGA